ncbi:RS-containing zinc finger protein [Trifolium repens]|nr:RS-containing zinc finger protein [Trifolium repens]
MTRVYIGNLDSRISERDLEDDFHVFGVIRSVWVARRPPGYAFIDFDDRRDALDAIRELDGMLRSIFQLLYFVSFAFAQILSILRVLDK